MDENKETYELLDRFIDKIVGNLKKQGEENLKILE